MFANLKMQKTALRNGILFYIALVDKKMAILGDAGINAKVPDKYWDELKNRMIEKFKQGYITGGNLRSRHSGRKTITGIFSLPARRR